MFSLPCDPPHPDLWIKNRLKNLCTDWEPKAWAALTFHTHQEIEHPNQTEIIFALDRAKSVCHHRWTCAIQNNTVKRSPYPSVKKSRSGDPQRVRSEILLQPKVTILYQKIKVTWSTTCTIRNNTVTDRWRPFWNLTWPRRSLPMLSKYRHRACIYVRICDVQVSECSNQDTHWICWHKCKYAIKNTFLTRVQKSGDARNIQDKKAQSYIFTRFGAKGCFDFYISTNICKAMHTGAHKKCIRWVLDGPKTPLTYVIMCRKEKKGNHSQSATLNTSKTVFPEIHNALHRQFCFSKRNK